MTVHPPHPVTPPASLAVDADIAAIGRIGAVPTILQVLSEVTGLRLALVARVTQSTWTACAVLDRMGFGLRVGGQLDVATTLCSEVRDSHAPIIIEHASREPAWCEHPTPKLYGLESYIAVPIFRRTGEYFGNVCALDSNPVMLRDDKTLAMMRLFSELISLQLAAEEDAVLNRAALSLEREAGELREEFIAVLGHDLRNPLFAILAGSEFLLGLPAEPSQRTVLERIRSSGRRMAQLIDELMDFARGRLGAGIPIARERVDVRSLVTDVVDEIAGARPGHMLRADVQVDTPVCVDRPRVAQMLSNLVGNAAEHGDAGRPIEVSATVEHGELVLRVASVGQPIPAEVRSRLFQPFVRTNDERPRAGLGLGLYIAAEIARAHGGTISADSRADGRTTFTVRLPHALVESHAHR